MSILIKGMEMPPSCFLCKLSFMSGERLFCSAMKNEEVLRSKIDSNCPLIEVPPHGRLIDADALVEILLKVIDINASIEQRNEATEQERRCLWWFEQQIGIAPTIIEAEGGE